MTLREMLFNSLWHCHFAEGDPARLDESYKDQWPESKRITDRQTDAALATFRKYLEENGLVVVPREATRDMLLNAGATPDGISPRGGTDYLGKMLPKYYAAMIAAAPAVDMGEREAP